MVKQIKEIAIVYERFIAAMALFHPIYYTLYHLYSIITKFTTFIDCQLFCIDLVAIKV